MEQLLLLTRKQQNLEDQCPSYNKICLYVYIPVMRIPFLPNQCPHFNCGHPRSLGILFPFEIFHLHDETLKSSALWLQEIQFSFRENREAFRSLMQHLSQEFVSLSSSIFQYTYEFNKNGLKYQIHGCSEPCLLCNQQYLIVIICIPVLQHHHVFFTTRSSIITAFTSNQIRESTPETTESIQNTHPQDFYSILFVPKSVLVS